MAVAAYGKEASPEAREDATASKLIAATEYQQSRVVVAGGGGLSIGGNFAIQGTIGQHDADPLQPSQGGVYSVVGGFWNGEQFNMPADSQVFSNGFE